MNAAGGRADRRRFLVGSGALVVGFAWPPMLLAQKAGRADGDKLPGSLEKQPMIDGWVRIDADGRITVFTGKAELGQGIKTALLQVAAEELMVAPQRIVLVTADTERTADEGYTAGSHSMQESATALRHAAAQARQIVLARAAQRLGVPVSRLTVSDGTVSVGAGAAGGQGVAPGNGNAYRATAGAGGIGYGELVADGALLHVRAAPQSPLRDPAGYSVIGKPLPRVDIPAKVCGGAAYVQDLRLPGMVHGRVVRPPDAGAQLVAIDATPVEAMPGVLRVVRDGRFVAVVAEREYQAVAAMRALAAAARWQAGPARLPPAEQLHASLREAPAEDHLILDRGRRRTAAAGTRTLSASYRRPYQMHASIGPSCAVAQWVAAKLTVWTHSQGVFPLRGALAELLRVDKAQVRCIHAEGAGCYGHNGADDVAADAALLARALPGWPVRVQWMREDEHAWEPLGPPMVADVRATLDGGAIVDWQYAVWSNTHSTRPGGAGDLLAATHLAQPFKPTPPKPLPLPDGGGDRNAIPLYAFPNARVMHHFLPQMPLRPSALRSLGAFLNIFAIESFLDELAAVAGADPVAFRLRHMEDARARQVMQTAADRFGWSSFPKPADRSARRGRGFAFARYKNQGAYAAIACEVEVWRDSGELRVVRVVAAVDSGEAVSPDGIRNQIEGGIVQSLSWATMEEVSFDANRVTSVDWGGYPVLRFPQAPGRVDVHIVDRPGQPYLGTGEAAQGPTAAAIANAVADATGVRMRELPLSRGRVRAALGP